MLNYSRCHYVYSLRCHYLYSLHFHIYLCACVCKVSARTHRSHWREGHVTTWVGPAGWMGGDRSQRGHSLSLPSEMNFRVPVKQDIPFPLVIKNPDCPKHRLFFYCDWEPPGWPAYRGPVQAELTSQTGHRSSWRTRMSRLKARRKTRLFPLQHPENITVSRMKHW